MNELLSHNHNWTIEEIEDLRVRFLEASDEEAVNLWNAIADGDPATEIQTENLNAFWTPEIGERLVMVLNERYTRHMEQ